MTIKAAGASLSFTEIEAEWDNASPFSLSEFYSGTSTVFSGAADGDGNAIPSSGAISFSDFYDTTYFQTTSASSATGNPAVTVPNGANAIFIVSMFGGGGGGFKGQAYTKAGGESAGAGGGGAGGRLGQYFTVTPGDQLSVVIGAGGAAGVDDTENNTDGTQFNHAGSAGNGVATVINPLGNNTQHITAGGGGGASAAGGFARGPLRSNTAGSAGGIGSTAFTQVTSGTTTSGVSVSAGSAGSGDVGGNAGNCGGDNCRIDGSAGGDSFNDNGAGGTGGSSSGNGTAGTAGAAPGGGGAGGSAQLNNGGGSAGGAGGAGSISYQFVRIV